MSYDGFLEAARLYVKQIDHNVYYELAIQAVYRQEKDISTVEHQLLIYDIFTELLLKEAKRRMIKNGFKNNKNMKAGMQLLKSNMMSTYWYFSNFPVDKKD